MISPDAVYDVLYLVDRLSGYLGDPTEAELNIFSYLACLLSLYSGNAVSEWGYAFAGTKEGSPFSDDLAEVVRGLATGGQLSKGKERIAMTERGRLEFHFLMSLEQNGWRSLYLDGAVSSLLALPVGLVREAILYEPTLRPTGALQSTRLLLTGAAIEILYDQFAMLKEAVGPASRDLLLPSTLWLTYLARSAEQSLTEVRVDA